MKSSTASLKKYLFVLVLLTSTGALQTGCAHNGDSNNHIYITEGVSSTQVAFLKGRCCARIVMDTNEIKAQDAAIALAIHLSGQIPLDGSYPDDVDSLKGIIQESGQSQGWSEDLNQDREKGPWAISTNAWDWIDGAGVPFEKNGFRAVAGEFYKKTSEGWALWLELVDQGSTKGARKAFQEASWNTGQLLSPNKDDYVSEPVYVAYHNNMIADTFVQYEWVKAGVDASIEALAGKDDIGEAWEMVFGNVNTQTKIAIKINCVKGQVSPQFETIKAIVTGLTKMCNGEFPAENISIFDNTMGFHEFGKERLQTIYGPKGIANLGIVYRDPVPEYADYAFEVSGKNYHPNAYLHQADYAISLAPLKRHQHYAGHHTGVIKNMMGAVSVSQTRFDPGSPVPFHKGHPFEAWVDLFTNYMRSKVKVYVIDMLFGTDRENDYDWDAVVKRIAVSQDPCALDSYAIDILHRFGLTGDKPPTKALPMALAEAGLGTTEYRLVAVPVKPTIINNRNKLACKNLFYFSMSSFVLNGLAR